MDGVVPSLTKPIFTGSPVAAFGVPSTLAIAPAAAIALVLTALLGALLYLVVFRPLRDAPPLARAVASLGVMVVIQSVMAIMVGSAPVAVKAIFPARRWEW